MKKNNESLFLFCGVFFVLLGVVLFCYDMYIVNNYEKINSKISIHRNSRNRKYATVDYEVDNKKYTEIGLSGYNILMKDGNDYIIYINPEKPDEPHCISYGIELLCLVAGIPCIKYNRKVKSLVG